MYKPLLCWRYLRTRYIALASVISVTLGVATMIVVNSVMAGFTEEMEDRIHGILSDVVFESRSLEGFHDPARHMEMIRQVAGDYIDGMTATVHVPAMLSFQYGENWITHPVQLVGVDASQAADAADMTRYLQHPDNRQRVSFDLQEGGYDCGVRMRAPAGEDDALRPQMRSAGWQRRRMLAEQEAMWRKYQEERAAEDAASERNSQPNETTPAVANPFEAGVAANPFDVGDEPQGTIFDPAKSQHDGAILGIAITSFRTQAGQEQFLALPGDDIKLTFPTSGTPPKAVSMPFTIVDFYESKMSEYDSSFVFVPLDVLQRSRGMLDPSTGVGNVTAIQVQLKDGANATLVRDLLRQNFDEQVYGIYTWRDKQGALLAAVDLETRILNLLLFLIIAVAGFGILAIFYMIVVEKTRDIGILKALGASGDGVMGIFLSYGMSLGFVGSGAGMVLGLLFVANINEIAGLLGRITGREVFDPTIYYFYEIPTIVHPWTVTWIVSGAVSIAILASILPARRAARLHPVEALRHE